MLNAIHSIDSYVVTYNNSPAYISNTGAMAGQVRVNTMTQSMEVYDGANWISYNNTSSVGLSFDAQKILQWAKKKMDEEAVLKDKMEKYPMLKDAYEQYKVIEALVYEEESNERS